MKTNCSNCQYGGYNPCSDICDECMNDPNTGWGGFYDHRIGRDFMSEEEQSNYYHKYLDDDEYDENDSII